MEKLQITIENTDFFDASVERAFKKHARLLSQSTNNSKDEYLTLDEAMQLAKIKSPSTFYKLRNQGDVETYYMSPRKILYSRKSIEKYLASKLNNIPG